MAATAKPAPSFADLQRNDIDGALAVAKAALDAGAYTAEVAQPLVMMQDDPRDFINRLAALRASYKSKKPRRRT